jgi:phage gp29-like protein
MLDRADRYARDLILGQTMTGQTGTTGKGGGQAFGKVELGVKEDRIDAAGKFVANVINQQFIKSILMLNYGNSDDAPKVRFLNDEEGDFTEAQRDKVLADMGVPIGVKFIQKKYGIPEPAEGEQLLEQAQPQPNPGAPDSTAQDPTDEGEPADRSEAETPDQEGAAKAKLHRLISQTSDAALSGALTKFVDELQAGEKNK